MPEEEFIYMIYEGKKEKVFPKSVLKTKITAEQFREWVINELNKAREDLVDDVVVERFDNECRDFYNKVTAKENADAELYEYDDIQMLSGSAGIVLLKGDLVVDSFNIRRS